MQKDPCGRVFGDQDCMWSRFITHRVTQSHTGSCWPALAPATPRPSPCLHVTPVPGQSVQWPGASLQPHPLLSALVSGPLYARWLSLVPPYRAAPTHATGAPTRGQRTSLCLPGLHPDLAARAVTHHSPDAATPSPGPCTCAPALPAPRPPGWSRSSVSGPCLCQPCGESVCPCAG